MTKNKTLELLAPAKDLATGIDAVNCGADAVYIGAEHFGARAAAGNTLADIEKLAAYAHRYRAKVYAAVNTLLSDEEIPPAQKLIVAHLNHIEKSLTLDSAAAEVDLEAVFRDVA